MKNYFDFAQLDFQQILTNPILDIAARFWDKDRYEAFKACYKSMRMVDDLVDNRKASGKISEDEKKQIIEKVAIWGKKIRTSKELNEIIKKFKIPMWPWQDLSKAMIYDINHNGFKTFNVFLAYSEGAAAAPASIFMHLCGVKKENNNYTPPSFNIKKTARPLALFAYLVHTIRDFQKDQKNNLNYFTEDLMAKNGLTLKMLKDIASGGTINTGFRNLMKEYHNFAESYRIESRKMLDNLKIEPKYMLSLEIIYNLYLQIFERIDIANGRFTATELNPSIEAVKERINKTLSSLAK